MEIKEIATMLGLSLKTVENQMGIALKKMREELTKLFGTEFISIALGAGRQTFAPMGLSRIDIDLRHGNFLVGARGLGIFRLCLDFVRRCDVGKVSDCIRRRCFQFEGSRIGALLLAGSDSRLSYFRRLGEELFRRRNLLAGRNFQNPAGRQTGTSTLQQEKL